MTRDELKSALEVAGYGERTINSGLAQFDRADYPKFFVWNQEFVGYWLYTVQLNFDTNGLDIRFTDGHASLLRLPMEHGSVKEIDTVALENRILAVNWAHDHRYLADEVPSAEHIQTAEITVPGIINDLAKLYAHSPEGQLLAERLCSRHIIWRMGEDRNSPLEKLLEQKYYVSEQLTGIVPRTEPYTRLAFVPYPEVDMRQAIADMLQRHLSYYLPITKTPIIMNLNNLQNLREELKTLGFDENTIKAMETEMEKNQPNFRLHTTLPADRGQIDVTLHFRQSGQSDYYYFNKYNLAWSKAKPLENDQKYLVLSKGENDKNLMKKFDSPLEAIEFFKVQKGSSELAVGKATDKDLPFKTTLATMKDSKVEYVAKEFQKDYYSPAISNTFYVEKGAGFPLNQAANLLQGRSVYREDLVNRAGEQYKAWSIFLFDKPKDKYGNYEVKQFSEGYGYDVKNALEEYRIKLDSDPKKQEQLITDLKNGNRPLVTVEGTDGKDVKLRIEAVPRYGNLNFYQPGNKAPEKREQFLKVPKQEKGQSKANAKEQSHDLSM